MPKRKREHRDDDLRDLRRKMKKLERKLESCECDKRQRRHRHKERQRSLSRSCSVPQKKRHSRSQSLSPTPAPPLRHGDRTMSPPSPAPAPALLQHRFSPQSLSSISRSRSRSISRDDRHAVIQEQEPNVQDECISQDMQSLHKVNPIQPLPTTSKKADTSLTTEPPLSEDIPVPVDILEPTLDTSILEILGDDPTQGNLFGPDIQKDLALRLEHCATNGLSKENRKILKEKYLLPKNCKLINAPVLNAEIKVALTDPVLKRVKAIEVRQQQLALAISAVSQSLTALMAENNKDTNIIKTLMDATRILCDCQHSDSIMRRFFVLTNLKKDLKDQLLLTKIDNFLFGENFADTLKTAKAINKSGSDLKVSATPKPRPPFTNKQPAATPGSSRPLNWKGPNPPRRQAELPRTREPAATKHRQWTSSRPSSQHPPRRNFRR